MTVHLPVSRKLMVMLASVLALVINALSGQPVPADQVWAVLTPIAAWLVGQGIADHGAQGKAIAKQRQQEVNDASA